jgi:hypothetical protein
MISILQELYEWAKYIKTESKGTERLIKLSGKIPPQNLLQSNIFPYGYCLDLMIEVNGEN